MPSTPPKEKIPDLERRVASDPASLLFVPLAEAYRGAGRLDDAERALRIGLGHHPGHHSGRTSLGRVLMESGQPEEARDVLVAVAEEVPDNLLARRLLDDLAARPAEAAAHHRAPEVPAPPRETRPLDLDDLRAREMSEEPPAAPDAPPLPTEELSGPSLAELYGRRGEVARAREIYRELQEREPHNPEWSARIEELSGTGAAPGSEAPPREAVSPTPAERPAPEGRAAAVEPPEAEPAPEPPSLFDAGAPASVPEPLPDDIWELEEEPPEPGPSSHTIPMGSELASLARQATPAVPPGHDAAAQPAGTGLPVAGPGEPAFEPGPPGEAPADAAARPASASRVISRERRRAALEGYLDRIIRSRGRHAG